MSLSKLPAYGAARVPAQRIIIVMSEEEIAAVDGWGGPAGQPSRSAAIRTLLKRGLEAVRKGGGPMEEARLER